MLDSAIAKGMALGECVLNEGRGVAYLKNVDANSIRFLKKNGELVLAQQPEGALQPKELENLDLIYYYAPHQRDGHPQGYSIYYSLVFVQTIYYKLLKNIDAISWRVGDPSFLISITGGEGGKETLINKAAASLQSNITKIMKLRKAGKVGDAFIGLPKGSTVQVDIIGQGSEKIINSLKFPIEHIIDATIGATGLPAWMLGFHRGTTERLSDNESDELTSRIEWYRQTFDPIIERFFTTALLSLGYAGAKWKHVWDEVNLRDEQGKATARYRNALAAEKEINNIITMFIEGFIGSQAEAEDLLRLNGLIPAGKSLPEGWFERKVLEVEAAKAMRYLD